ncbi:putative membrane protein [Oxalobacteraceae bacterium GrIS 1.11]
MMENTTQKYFHWGAIGSLLALIAWCLLWETVVAPLHPGGSWMALKAAPLLIPLHGVIRRDVYTLQWSSMVILLYFTEGVVRGYSDKLALSSFMGWGEAILVCVYFMCSVLYLRPYKKAAKRIAKELLDKVNRAR